MIYFDNAASVKVKKEVLDHYVKMNDFFASSSSLHQLGVDALVHLQRARKKMAELLKVKEKEIVFTSGASESNNMILKGFLNKNKKHIITTSIEHPSVLETTRQLAEFFNYNITYLPLNNEDINYDRVYQSLSTQTLLVSVIWVNNEVGSIHDINKIREIIDLFNKNNHTKILLHSDVTQAIGKISVDFSKLDLASFSFHKIGGLKGSGFIYIKEGINLLPLISGGSQEAGKRAGTVDVAKICANVVSLEMALQQLDANQKQLKGLSTYLLSRLKEIQGVVINTPINHCNAIINFSFSKCRSEVLINAFSNKKIYLSATASCSSGSDYCRSVYEIYQDLSRARSSLRISLDSTNTIEEIDLFINSFKDILKELKYGNNND